jgi:hypothetical protein
LRGLGINSPTPHFKNYNDPYWEKNQKPQAESGMDLRGRKTNRAGIDISYILAKKIGLAGFGQVSWRGQ